MTNRLQVAITIIIQGVDGEGNIVSAMVDITVMSCETKYHMANQSNSLRSGLICHVSGRT